MEQQQRELQRLQLEAFETQKKTLEAEKKLQELNQQQQQHMQMLQLEALEAERKTLEAEKKLQIQRQEQLVVQQQHVQQQNIDMLDEVGPLSSSSAGSMRRQQQQYSLPPPPSAATYRSRLQTISAAGDYRPV